jgi:hypothetical protein
MHEPSYVTKNLYDDIVKLTPNTTINIVHTDNNLKKNIKNYLIFLESEFVLYENLYEKINNNIKIYDNTINDEEYKKSFRIYIKYICDYFQYNKSETYEKIFNMYKKLLNRANELIKIKEENNDYDYENFGINNLYVNIKNKVNHFIHASFFNYTVAVAIHDYILNNKNYLTILNITNYVMHYSIQQKFDDKNIPYDEKYVDFYFYNSRINNEFIQIHMSFHDDTNNIQGKKSHINVYCVPFMYACIKHNDIISNDDGILRDKVKFQNQGKNVSSNVNNTQIMCLDFGLQYLFKKNISKSNNEFKLLIDKEDNLHTYDVSLDHTIIHIDTYSGKNCINLSKCISYDTDENKKNILKLIIKCIVQQFYCSNQNANQYGMHFFNQSYKILYNKKIYDMTSY